VANVVYRHLRGPLRHSRDCDQRCAAGCEVRQFEQQLDAPVTAADMEADQRRERRMQAMLRGEIPA
jgi:hypothetical protein